MTGEEFDALPTTVEAKSQGKPIGGWRFAPIDPDTRLYYSLYESSQPRSGFDFCCVEWVGDDGGGGDIPDNGIASPTCRVRTLFEGCAYFDGIRHLYFVGDGEGYVYYARLDLITTALAALRSLELEHCWDASKPTTPPPPSPHQGTTPEGR